ncbi:Potassium-transporting ATPase [Paraburkholderia phenoliruptrix BR3459a]|nr:Potassium-transporting ATPase [Paraburkholderia phenoliruptrix BR3459a]
MENKNGCAVRRGHRALYRADRCIDCRLREAAADSPRTGSALMNWMLWMSGAATALLFAYLVYALLRAEDIE